MDKLLERMLERMLEKHGKLCNCEVCTEARAAVEEHKEATARLAPRMASEVFNQKK